MKRLAYLLPMAAIALASCSSDETIATQASLTDDAIFIHPVVPGATRATEVGVDNLGSFTVIAGASQGLKETTGFTATVTPIEGTSTWGMNEPHYWTQDVNEAGTNVSFTAYAPAEMTESNGKITVDLTGSTISDQKDIVVAYNTGNKTANVTNGVSLYFKHALSQIVIKAANKNTQMREVKVLGVKLMNIPSKADLNLPTTATAEGEDLTSPWSTLVADTETDLITKGALDEDDNDDNNPVTLGSDATDIMFGNGSFMLIPQQLTAWDGGNTSSGAYISVLCQITNKTDNSQIFPTTTDQYAFTAVPIDTNWEPGKKYTYTLNFYSGDDGGAGKVDPDPTNPDDGNDDNIDPDPGNGGDSTDPGVEKPIIFTVDVDTWTPVNVAEQSL